MTQQYLQKMNSLTHLTDVQRKAFRTRLEIAEESPHLSKDIYNGLNLFLIIEENRSDLTFDRGVFVETMVRAMPLQQAIIFKIADAIESNKKAIILPKGNHTLLVRFQLGLWNYRLEKSMKVVTDDDFDLYGWFYDNSLIKNHPGGLISELAKQRSASGFVYLEFNLDKPHNLKKFVEHGLIRDRYVGIPIQLKDIVFYTPTFATDIFSELKDEVEIIDKWVPYSKELLYKVIEVFCQENNKSQTGEQLVKLEEKDYDIIIQNSMGRDDTPTPFGVRSHLSGLFNFASKNLCGDEGPLCYADAVPEYEKYKKLNISLPF